MRVLALTLFLLVTACGDSGAADTTTTVPEAAVDLSLIHDDIVEFAHEDASTRADVDASTLIVVRAQHVVWNDASLGCPQGGYSYGQVLTEGYWLVLEAEGTEYDYRAALEGDVRLCPRGHPPHEVVAP